MKFEQPEIRDYGDLALEITNANGGRASEDGSAKSIQLTVDPLVQATVTVSS